MIKMVGIPITLFAAAVAPVAAKAQIMWQNVERGMTPDQVRQAQPQAENTSNPETLFDGSKCSLRIPQYQVGNDSFEVCFFFKFLSLSQVTLGMIGQPDKLDFENVIELLTARYGTPIDVSENALGWEADWVLPSGINIAVIYIAEPLIPLININYQNRLATDSSKL